MSRARRVSLALGSVLLAAAGAVVSTAPNWLFDALAKRYAGCLYRVATTDSILALTFDDGPDPLSTPAILRELRQHQARATFFLISDRVRNQQPLVRQLLVEGHEVGNHFTRDRPSIRLSPEEFEEDLLQAHRVLAPFGQLRWARPASGWYTQSMVSAMSRHDYRCALGSVYPLDAALPSVAWASHYILRNARPGAIVILHDGGARGRRTARVLARVLPKLRQRGYRVVTLSELVAAT